MSLLPPNHAGLLIRRLAVEDSMEVLTQLVHEAYAPHAIGGLRFWGTHQSVADTAQRLASGIALVASIDDTVIGTVTLRRPALDSPVLAYRNPVTWSLCQLAVRPTHKGQGIGSALHKAAAAIATEHGASTLALHTAAPATALIRLYERWGYRIVGDHDWRPHTNFSSVVMTRRLDAP